MLVGKINSGLLAYIGVSDNDTESDVTYIADKIVNLRIFKDQSGNMNLSALDLNSEILIISQFTLYADCRKGRRPSYKNAAPANTAKEIYKDLINKLKESHLKVESGKFQSHMNVISNNDGPITIIIDSSKSF